MFICIFKSCQSIAHISFKNTKNLADPSTPSETSQSPEHVKKPSLTSETSSNNSRTNLIFSDRLPQTTQNAPVANEEEIWVSSREARCRSLLRMYHSSWRWVRSAIWWRLTVAITWFWGLLENDRQLCHNWIKHKLLFILSTGVQYHFDIDGRYCSLYQLQAKEGWKIKGPTSHQARSIQSILYDWSCQKAFEDDS